MHNFDLTIRNTLEMCLSNDKRTSYDKRSSNDKRFRIIRATLFFGKTTIFKEFEKKQRKISKS